MWPSINFVGLQVQLRGRRVCGLVNFTLRSNANSQYSIFNGRVMIIRVYRNIFRYAEKSEGEGIDLVV